MSATEFTPDRSAALRELLLTTVREEPKRQRRLQILLTSVLAAVAIVLAGGTAALALTGVIRFGDDAPAPAPAPTSTFTPTPAPTSTPSPAPTKPVVQSGPIAPHDVDSLPASTRWSIDLPGDKDCSGAQTFTLSDGRALYLSGQRPKEYESDTSPCPGQKSEDVALTLVDTQSGTVLWSREWKFDTESPLMTTVVVLGTSGRAVISYGHADVGPHEVIDLTTGAELTPFVEDTENSLRGVVSVPGDSGDLIEAVPVDGDSNRETVMRFDPRDREHPVWSTQLDGSAAYLAPVFDGSSRIGVNFYASGSPGQPSAGTLSLATGEFVHVNGEDVRWYEMSSIALRSVQASDDTITLIAEDANGSELWTRDVAKFAQIAEIRTPDQRPGGRYGLDGSGLLTITDGSTVTVIDGTTGATQWSASIADCLPQPGGAPSTTVTDDSRDAYVDIFSFEAVCTMSRADGELLSQKIPLEGWAVQGSENTYGYDPMSSDDGSAYDRATGDVLWTRPRVGFESWSFDGGYLVSHRQNHIESIG